MALSDLTPATSSMRMAAVSTTFQPTLRKRV
jgi:hypothetical protein